MEGHCSTGQSPQWDVVRMEEEEEEEEEGEEEEEEEEEKKRKRRKKKKKKEIKSRRMYQTVLPRPAPHLKYEFLRCEYFRKNIFISEMSADSNIGLNITRP